ncbi:zinc finger protein 888-like [Anneissia japonica]|uniref:zinc finger protein 888-like n=1 Tax=Anneissia japonica TaxID=1529436 RepID=UPI001425B550|nr:zinc finger protein 888-like [Anneissia japonica]XP_033107586.1 zinc finger protein 888-like [Anneissia japonica]XP_033107588.1 zinc finger protein 888-like [Anneissia japonica]XP_033107589.1 zinc finger protein 888-like [Anneissia japonica]XP_033107590.1 zinc finger protein 888-like [Anneissia japonica]
MAQSMLNIPSSHRGPVPHDMLGSASGVHSSIEQGDDKSKYECRKCKTPFQTAVARLSHEISGCIAIDNLHHYEPPANHHHHHPSLGQNTAAEADTKEMYQCHHCRAYFSTAVSRLSHELQDCPALRAGGNNVSDSPVRSTFGMKSSKDVHSPDNPKDVANQSARDRSPVRTEPAAPKEYKCKLCPQIFYTRSDVNLHTRSHKEGKPHKCQDCGKTFASTSYLSQHTRIHTGEKPYKCEFCEKSFKQLSHLQQHTRIHTGDRPYRCTYPDCDKAFTQLANLQSHTRKHTKDKPFKCRDCYRAFDDAQALQHHASCHAHTRRERKLSCGVCGKAYAQELYLIKHMESKHPQSAATSSLESQKFTGNGASKDNASENSGTSNNQEHKKYPNHSSSQLRGSDHTSSKQEDIQQREEILQMKNRQEEMLMSQHRQEILNIEHQEMLSRERQEMINRERQEIMNRVQRDELLHQGRQENLLVHRQDHFLTPRQQEELRTRGINMSASSTLSHLHHLEKGMLKPNVVLPRMDPTSRAHHMKVPFSAGMQMLTGMHHEAMPCTTEGLGVDPNKNVFHH